MRNLSAGNKKDFTIFAVIILLIIGVFIISLNYVLATESKEYTIKENSIIFDEDYNIIELKQDSQLYKKWTKNFYLKMDNDEYKIGKQAICYNERQNRLQIYADSFEIKKGGEVNKYVDSNEILNLSQDRFFKLEDRKYLVVGEKIRNSTGSLDTKNFLIVKLDKNGNTLLANQELSMKTIKPMKIETESFKFDVANEKLFFEKEEIDLKKIIGSSNEYKEIKQEEKKSEENETDEETKTEHEQLENKEMEKNNQGKIETNSNDNNSNNSDNNNNKNNSNNNNQNGQQNKSQNNEGTKAETKTNIQSQVQTQTISQNTTKEQNQNKTPLSKSINLRSVTPRTQSIDVQYIILDTENRYQTVFLDVQGDTQQTIALDKSKRNYLITGLTPNTEYKVTLAYKEIATDNSIVDGIEDTIIVRTPKIQDTLTIDKIAKNKLYFTYKVDPNYVYESGKIALYNDGEKVEELDIDIVSAMTTNGWTSCFDYKYGNEIILKLEKPVYEEKEVKRNLQAKLKVY